MAACRVVCTACDWQGCRHDFQELLARMNPATAEYAQELLARKLANEARRRALAAGTAADAAPSPSVRQPHIAGAHTWQSDPACCQRLGCAVQAEEEHIPIRRPDGDVELTDSRHFDIPACPSCGGILKPGVVFFGGSVPPASAGRAGALAEACDAALIVGSSVSTYSVFKHLTNMHRAGKPLAAVNVGRTRADEMLRFKAEARVGEVMMRLAAHPALLLPKPL